MDSAGAVSMITKSLDVDVVVPHMFCYPGYTSFRSMFDMLNIPYIGTAAEMQGLLCDKWMTRGLMAQDDVRVAEG
jgi:D-alanine-D-alanine ligase